MLYLYCLLQSFIARRPWKSEDGVTAIEYGLIAALIAVVIIAAVSLVGNNLGNVFNTVGNKLAPVT